LGNVERLMIVRKTYNCVIGSTFVISPDLAYVRVHKVALGGNDYNVFEDNNDSLVTGLSVRHAPGLGGLYFDENIPFESGNTINVVYEN